MNLEKLGWNNYFEEEFRVYFNKGLIAGRIVSQQKNNYLLHYEKGIHDSGAMIIDTPGLRELQLWGDENGVEESFKDVASLAENCKFKDCNHDKEPGCAIKQAIEDGIISQERFESYMKQLGEIKRLSKEKRQYEIFKSRKSKREV